MRLCWHIKHTVSTAQPYQFVGQLGYYTHVQDANLPLLQLGVRFYDPEVGRFTQVDMAKHGLNWYVYSGNQPSNWVDPRGTKCERITPEKSTKLGLCLLRLKMCMADDDRIGKYLKNNLGRVHWYECDQVDLGPDTKADTAWRIIYVTIRLIIRDYSCKTVLHELSHAADGYFYFTGASEDRARDCAINKYDANNCSKLFDDREQPPPDKRS